MRTLFAFLFLVLCSFMGDSSGSKPYQFEHISFSVNGSGVSMTPLYGKVYGRIDTIEVSWSVIGLDNSGKTSLTNDRIVVPVNDNIRRAYFEAKNIFEEKHQQLQKMFEDAFLPKESQLKK